MAATSLLASKCCFCIPLQVGAFIFGYTLAIINTAVVIRLCINIGLLRAAVAKHPIFDAEFNIIAALNYISVIIFAIQMLLAFVLLVGLHMKKWKFLRVYFIGYLICMMIRILLIVVNLALFGQYYLLKQWLWQIPGLVIMMCEAYSLFIANMSYNDMRENEKRSAQNVF